MLASVIASLYLFCSCDSHCVMGALEFKPYMKSVISCMCATEQCCLSQLVYPHTK